jgi:hypothetical protein
MEEKATYFWLVIWRLGQFGQTPGAREVVVNSIQIPSSATATFERVLHKRGLPDAGRGATRGGSIVEQQFLLRQLSKDDGQRGGLELIEVDVRRQIEDFGGIASTIRFALVQSVDRSAVVG